MLLWMLATIAGIVVGILNILTLVTSLALRGVSPALVSNHTS